MAGDDVEIRIRANNGDAVRAFRDVNGRLRDMRGRFVSESRIISGSLDGVTKSLGKVRGSLIPLATAGVPALAALGMASVKTAGSVAGAGLAVAAFGVAVAGQVGSLSDAADAQTKYTDAVVKHGRGSKQAAEAQRAVQAELASMPAATARVAVAARGAKDDFKAWSDEMADFTMQPVEKGITLLGQALPRLTPMARGASEQLDRLVTVAGGAMATPGFDALSEKVSTFANDALRDAVTGIIGFSLALSRGEAGGPIRAFMDYARRNGPAVQETLSTIGDALTTLAQGAAEAGPGMLTLVTAVAKLVAALPPELVTIAMQAAVGLKLMSLAGAGVATTAEGVGRLRDAMLSMAAASTAAGGGMAGARAAFASMSTTFKGGLIAAGIAAAAVGINELAESARGAPPDVDKLTTSLKELAVTGKFTGELKKTFGDFDGLIDKMKKFQTEKERAAKSDGFEIPGISHFTDWVGDLSNDLIKGEEGLKALREDFKSLDESLVQMASSGHAEEAAAQFEAIKAAALANGIPLKAINEDFSGLKSKLADMGVEAKLTAEGMGIFGKAAQDTSVKLSAQKQAADGLRASILALNDVNRSAFDAQTAFGKSLDDLTASFKLNGATLSADTKAGQANRDAMSQAAAAHDEMVESALAAGESLGSTSKKSREMRSSMLELATAALGSKSAAEELVNSLIGVPSDIKTMYRLEKEEAVAGLKGVQEEISKTPGKKSITVDTLNAAAIAALEAVGLKTKQLPDGRTQVFTANSKALGSISAVREALNNLNGKTANTYTTHNVYYRVAGTAATALKALSFFNANGSVMKFYADGGSENHVAQMAPAGSMRVWAEPETGGESYIPHAPSKRPRSRRIAEETVSILGGQVEWFANGGVRKSEMEARKGARGELTISHFGQKAGNKNTEFANDLGAADSLKELVSALNKWRSVIKKATHGGVEESLLKKLNSAGKALLKYEKQHESLTKTLKKAKELRDSVASGLRGEAGIVKAANAEDSQVTINTLLSQMTASAANTKQFSGMLTELRKRGVNKDIIKQIAEAGIEGGGMETAAAVLGGGSAEIKRLNSLQSQINKHAKSAGNATADAMYGAGLKAGEGIIAGLEKKQKDIEKAMMKIAKSMEKSIKKALGIKSPSKVMEEIGNHTAEGFAIGVRKNRSVTPAWESMLNQPRATTPGPATRPAAGGSVSQPIVLNVSIAGRDFGQLLVDVGRKEVDTRGGLRATFGRL